MADGQSTTCGTKQEDAFPAPPAFLFRTAPDGPEYGGMNTWDWKNVPV